MKKVFFLLAAVFCTAIILSGCYGNSKMAEPGSTEDQISPIEPIETIPSTEPQVSQLQHTLRLAKQNMKSHGDEAYYVQDPDDDYLIGSSLLVTNEMLSTLETAPETLTAGMAKDAFRSGEGYAAGDDYRIMVSKDLNSYAVYYIPSGHMYYCADSCRGEYVMVDDMEVMDSIDSYRYDKCGNIKDIFSDEVYLSEAYLDGTWDGKMIKCLKNNNRPSGYDYVYYVGSEFGIEFLYEIALYPDPGHDKIPFHKEREFSPKANLGSLTASNVVGVSGTFLDLDVVVCFYNEGTIVFRDDGTFDIEKEYSDYQFGAKRYGEILAFDNSPADRSYILGQYDNEIWYIRYVDDLDHCLYDKYGNIRLDENGNREYAVKQDGYLYKVVVSDGGNIKFDKVPISGWYSESKHIPPESGESFSFIDDSGSQKTYTISGDVNIRGYGIDDRKIVEVK